MLPNQDMKRCVMDRSKVRASQTTHANIHSLPHVGNWVAPTQAI
jgi:hypothetical protein